MNGDNVHRWVSDELVRLLEIPSVSGQEAEILAYLEGRISELGFEFIKIPTPSGFSNLVIGSLSPQLVLTAHVDTVEPTWPSPWGVRTDNGQIAGLGAIDDKSGVVVCLLTLMMAREQGVFPGHADAAVALTVDEEIGGTGSAAVAEALNPRYVVAIEGTELGLATVEAGAIEGRITVRGTSVHGALIEHGDNAIVKASRLILELADLPFTQQFHPLVGHALPSVEQIEGGSDLWVIPDSASMRLEIRLLPGMSSKDVIAQVRTLCNAHDATYEVGEISEPFEISRESLLRRVFARAGEEALGEVLQEIGMPSWTDAHNFVDISQSEAVIFGPGSLELAHHPDEIVSVEEIVQSAKVLTAVLSRWPHGDGELKPDLGTEI